MENELGGECSTYGREQKFIHGFGAETLKKETSWKIYLYNIKINTKDIDWWSGE
jgi:hypothetical protein